MAAAGGPPAFAGVRERNVIDLALGGTGYRSARIG